MLTVTAIIDAINLAKTAVGAVTDMISDGKSTIEALSSEDEALLEAKIAELEAMLPELRRTTQAKLRGG